MKITQAQYFEIEEFLIEKCRLFETEFIEEMTDHFIDAIEVKLTGSVSFDEALFLTIQDFAGSGVIRKMEWQYRKGFVKKQLRTLFNMQKSQFSGFRLVRTLIVSGLITALCLYLGLYTKDMKESYDFVKGVLSGAGIVPAFTLPVFFLQRHIKWLDIFGGIKSQTAVRASITYLLIVTAVLSSRAISEYEFTALSGALLQSVVWTALAISCMTLFEYSQKYEENYWYVTR